MKPGMLPNRSRHHPPLNFHRSLFTLLLWRANRSMGDDMSSGTLFDYFKHLPSADDLKRWEEEHARMGLTIQELTEKRHQLGQLIKVAAAIHGGEVARVRGIGNANLGRARGGESGTWLSAILQIAERHPDGISYDDIRSQMPEPYASKLSRDPVAKSFYGALGKLEGAGKIVRYHGHVFTPEGIERHKARVASGEISDVQGHDYRGSPMTDELMGFLAENPRSAASAIKAHLCTFAEYRKGLKNHSSAIYNLLRRLRDREQVIRHADGTYSLPNENEAPDGSAVGAPDDGRAGTLPFENVVGFPRPR